MRSMHWLGFALTAVFVLFSCGCGGVSTAPPHVPAALSAGNVNLIFVVSEDLLHHDSDALDVNPLTTNLTNQGLQRSLLTAPFLQRNVLGENNVTGIYALEPMSHLQTTRQGTYPDIVAMETIQQFALLNQITVPASLEGTARYTGNSFPINTAYGSGPLPPGVAASLIYCQGCQGLDLDSSSVLQDQLSDNNQALINQILFYDVPGFYVFAAPWETTSSMLTSINSHENYNLTLPASYEGPNFIYAISIPPSGKTTLVTYNSQVNPPSMFPALPPPALASAPCPLTGKGAQTYFNIVIPGVNAPAGINTNETVYLVRHAEAHPTYWFEDGNYVAAGQWRALDLPNALLGKLNPVPTQIYSIDPAQATPSGYLNFSYVRPSLTAEPYAIANNLPLNLVANFEMFDLSHVIGQENQFFFNVPTYASDPLFSPGPPSFSGQAVLLTWEHSHFAPTVNALLASYGSSQQVPVEWQDNDYDTIWTVRIDGSGNLTVNNALCEGIDSAKLPATAPQF
ncbi:MAG: hypothetical protein WA718_04480 [Terriglobales bacterium]